MIYELFITTILGLMALYLVCGLIFAFPFLIKGVNRIDEGAHDSGWGFRLIILPGTILLWPVLLKKWFHAKKHQP